MLAHHPTGMMMCDTACPDDWLNTRIIMIAVLYLWLSETAPALVDVLSKITQDPTLCLRQGALHSRSWS